MNLDHDDRWDYPISEEEYYRREEWLDRNERASVPSMLDIPKCNVDSRAKVALIDILQDIASARENLAIGTRASALWSLTDALWFARNALDAIEDIAKDGLKGDE